MINKKYNLPYYSRVNVREVKEERSECFARAVNKVLNKRKIRGGELNSYAQQQLNVIRNYPAINADTFNISRLRNVLLPDELTMIDNAYKTYDKILRNHFDTSMSYCNEYKIDKPYDHEFKYDLQLTYGTIPPQDSELWFSDDEINLICKSHSHNLFRINKWLTSNHKYITAGFFEYSDIPKINQDTTLSDDDCKTFIQTMLGRYMSSMIWNEFKCNTIQDLCDHAYELLPVLYIGSGYSDMLKPYTSHIKHWLARYPNIRIFAVLNLSASYEGRGTHWVSVEILSDKIYYICSQGGSVDDLHSKDIYNINHNIISSKQTYQVDNNSCGMYASLYQLFMSKYNYNRDDVYNALHEIDISNIKKVVVHKIIN